MARSRSTRTRIRDLRRGRPDLLTLIHDLRTPLTVISGFAELLERQADRLDAGQRSEYASRIAVAAREMHEILDRGRPRRLGSDGTA